MDDSMMSVMDETEGVELFKELLELSQKAGMKTHKWFSNSLKVLEIFHHIVELLNFITM